MTVGHIQRWDDLIHPLLQANIEIAHQAAAHEHVYGAGEEYQSPSQQSRVPERQAQTNRQVDMRGPVKPGDLAGSRPKVAVHAGLPGGSFNSRYPALRTVSMIDDSPRRSSLRRSRLICTSTVFEIPS
jgi:hypothetical protein